ncbi:MAG TPA: PfkB family carbohydrate kinase, partial [Acidobacteriota bacterium]|nr:PfkB family carbohydrate kinase [Acidobacteriota bacterium]
SLGGAGNAIQNLKALGAFPVPVGVVGRDAAGRKVLSLLRSRGVPTDHIISEKNYRTPLKTRIMAGEDNTRKQQILRIDREGRVPDSPALSGRIRKAVGSVIRDGAALLISDYNYDTVKKVIYAESLPAAAAARVPVAVDSRFRLMDFAGATIATPNESEVEAALNIATGGNTAALYAASAKVLKKLRSPALLVTRGSRGMVLFERGKPPFPIPVRGTTDIVDVTGAGDTVISVFTLALAAGASFREAAELANFAGGVVVMKKGAATLGPRELRQAIRS